MNCRFNGHGDTLPSRGGLSCREIIAYTAALGSAFMAAQGLADDDAGFRTAAPGCQKAAKRYDMKQSINLWALPYPQKMTLRRCFELCKEPGFEGVEVNYALDGDLSPESSEAHMRDCGKMARDMGPEISGGEGLFLRNPQLRNRRRRHLGLLLSVIDQAGEGQEQHMPWLRLGLHVLPDARFGFGASGIVSSLSSVAPSVTGARVKALRHNRSRPG